MIQRRGKGHGAVARFRAMLIFGPLSMWVQREVTVLVSVQN
jgi:hypothetical protein